MGTGYKHGKSQYMATGKEGSNLQTDMGTIKTTQEYKYLGVVLASGRRDEKYTLDRINKGRAVMKQVHSSLWITM